MLVTGTNKDGTGDDVLSKLSMPIGLKNKSVSTRSTFGDPEPCSGAKKRRAKMERAEALEGEGYAVGADRYVGVRM